MNAPAPSTAQAAYDERWRRILDSVALKQPDRMPVKHLVDKVWNGSGNLILDTAFGIPDETPVDNVRAMFAAARKYVG